MPSLQSLKGSNSDDVYLHSSWTTGFSRVAVVLLLFLLIFASINSLSKLAFAQVEQDIEPPSITGTIPEDGETNVPVLLSFGIVVIFSEDMDPDTFTNSSIQLEDSDGNMVEGIVSYCLACFTPQAKFEFFSPLENSEMYFVTVSGELKDLAGNNLGSEFAFSFTTIDPDTIPPQIDHTVPDDGAIGVPIYVEITAIFDGPVDSEPPSADWFTLADQDGNLVSGDASLNGLGIAVFSPTSDLEFSTTYIATIKAGIEDDAGNPITSDHLWSFTTKSEKEARQKIFEFNSGSSAHATWINENEDGSTEFTQIDLLQSRDSDSDELVGTSITLSQFVEDEEGNQLLAAFGDLFTTENVYDFSTRLHDARLSPVVVPMLVCDQESCTNTIWTIEAQWQGTGELETVRDAFTYISGAIAKSQIKAGSELLQRAGTATGTLNGENVGVSEGENTFINLSGSEFTKYGDIDLGLGLSIGDYFAPTFEQGLKTIRGGQGTTATGFWEIENPDGTKTLIQIYVANMFDEIGRLTFFFDETQVFFERVVVDQDGNTISDEFGSVVIPIPENEGIFKVDKKLRNGILSPVEIEICSSEDRDEFFNCIDSEIVTVAATWKGVGQLDSTHFRLTAIADCGEFLCVDENHGGHFNVKIIGSGQTREAVVSANLNGSDIGQGDLDPLGLSARLTTSERLEIQYGLPFPFGIFPIQVS